MLIMAGSETITSDVTHTYIRTIMTSVYKISYMPTGPRAPRQSWGRTRGLHARHWEARGRRSLSGAPVAASCKKRSDVTI